MTNRKKVWNQWRLSLLLTSSTDPGRVEFLHPVNEELNEQGHLKGAFQALKVLCHCILPSWAIKFLFFFKGKPQASGKRSWKL